MTHPPGLVALPTRPGWDQVVYAASGLFDAVTDDATWLVPPHRALCVPDGERVRVLSREPTTMRCLYLRRHPPADDTSNDPLGEPFMAVRAVDLSPLTRELLLRAVELGPLELVDERERALVSLLVRELAHEPSNALRLPLPRDDRARSVAMRIVDDPTMELGDAIREAGASRRTVERIVRAETGLTLARWRRRSRVLAAIEPLMEGARVSDVAPMVGYATPSSFVEAFRSELGTSPKRFVADRRTITRL